MTVASSRSKTIKLINPTCLVMVLDITAVVAFVKVVRNRKNALPARLLLEERLQPLVGLFRKTLF